MKKSLLSIAVLGCIAVSPAFAAKPESDKDKLSYSFGHNVGTELKKRDAGVNLDVMMQGMKDALAGKSEMSREEITETLVNFNKQFQAKQAEQEKAMAKANLETGKAFLEENKKKEGVVVLASGLQYKVIKAGTGKMPKATDTVTTHYRGTLIDGTEFDSSYSRGEPTSFPVNGVISGWTEALQLMKEGAKWQLFIPADLAYGDRSVGGKIKPNSTLLFDIELISVDEKK